MRSEKGNMWLDLIEEMGNNPEGNNLAGEDLEKAQGGLEKAARFLKNPKNYFKSMNFGKSLYDAPITHTYNIPTELQNKNIINFLPNSPNNPNNYTTPFPMDDYYKHQADQNFINRSEEIKINLPLTRVVDSKGLVIEDGKLWNNTEPRQTKGWDGRPSTSGNMINRNTIHWSYGHVGDPGHGRLKTAARSTAIISDFESLKSKGYALDFDPTDTFFYTQGNMEVPEGSLVLTRDKTLYDNILKNTNIKNIKYLPNTNNEEFQKIVDSYGKRTDIGSRKLFEDYLKTNWEKGLDVAHYKPASHYEPRHYQGRNINQPYPESEIYPGHPDWDPNNKTIGDPFGGGESKMHSGTAFSSIERIGNPFWEYGKLYPEDRAFKGLLKMPKEIQILEMDKYTKSMRHPFKDILEMKKIMAENSGFTSYKEFKDEYKHLLKDFKEHGGENHHEWADYDLTSYQEGDEVEEVEFVQDEYGNIDTQGIDYTNKQLYPFIKNKYTKRNTSNIQQNLLDKLSSQTFRDRYRKNIFNMTGENLSEEELTTRINQQYDFSAAGAPFHITFPYVSHSPQGYRRVHTPYIHPYHKNKAAKFTSARGMYTENPYWGREDEEMWDPNRIYGSIVDINMPEMAQYSFVPHLFDARDNQIIGDYNQVQPYENWHDIAVHEYAHSYNTEKSPLFRPEGNLFHTYPAKISGNRDDAWHDIPGEKYKTWLTGLFGEDYWDKKKNPYGVWAMKPWEISSIRAENEDKLRRFGIWDNTKEPFSADKHLNLMLKTDAGNLSGDASNYHLRMMGFNDLDRMHYDIKKIKKTQKRRLEDFDWRLERGYKGESGDYIWQMLDFNNDLATLRNDPDAKPYEIKKLERNQVMDMNTFNELFNSSQSDLDEKHRYDDYNSLIKHVNLKKNVFNKKKIERANKVLDSLYDKVRKQLEVNPELDDLQNQFNEKKKEVGPKLEMYFNEIAQNEGEEQPVMAKHGIEVGASDTDIVTDKYNLETEGVDDFFMESSGNEEVIDPPATKYGKEISVWNKDRYSTSAKKYRRGGESLPKYQIEGEVKELTDLEKTRQGFSQTGEYYGGVLSGHEIQDIFDFTKGRYKDEFVVSYNYGLDGSITSVNLDPEVLKWRSKKGFSTQDLLMWYAYTQGNIPFINEDGSPIDVSDGSNWKGKNYGYIFDGENFSIDHPYKDLRWYPKNKDMAHAMSRDMYGATGNQLFFYEGYPFTNEEGDEKDIRLGLKPNKLITDLQSLLTTANSKMEVKDIMENFYNSFKPDNNGNYSKDQNDALLFMANKRNPFNFSDGALMKIADVRNLYLSSLELGQVRNYHGGKVGKILTEPEDIRNSYVNYLFDKLTIDHAKELGDQSEILWGDMFDYLNRVIDGDLGSYFDDYAMELIDHANLATFRSKKEFTDWTKSAEFKQGYWNPSMISYLGNNGEIVQGVDIDLPYNTMYQAYKPWHLAHVEGTPEKYEWPIDPFDGKPQYRIYNKTEALQSNMYPVAGYGKAQSILGGLLSGLSDDWDVNIPPWWGGSGSIQGLADIGTPPHNPYKEYFEYYDYDSEGMVTKVNKFRNPTYDSEVSKKYREIMGPNGDGKGGTITTNIHGNQVLNWLHPNTGPYSTEALDNGFAIQNNPYFSDPDAMTTDVQQIIQPHKFVNMSDKDVERYMINLSGKSDNWAHEWNGMNWLGGAGLGYQVTKAGLLKAATWKTAGNTIGHYWKNPGKWGLLGFGAKTLNYGFQSGMKLYDKTSLGRITGAAVPGTGGLLNINNIVIGNWTIDHMTDSYDHFNKGEILSGTADLAFSTLNSALLYNRLKSAYGAQNWLNYGKFPNLTGATAIQPKGSGPFVPVNPEKVGPLSQIIRKEVPVWSLREQTNRLFNKNIFQPQITQPKLTSHMNEILQKQQMNQYGDFTNIVPKFNLLPPNYKLGDFSKNKIMTE